jgi:hypothetical protein
MYSLWGPLSVKEMREGGGVVWMSLVFMDRSHMSDLMRDNIRAPSSHIFLFLQKLSPVPICVFNACYPLLIPS